LDGIILPGGESTTMIHLLRLNHLWEPLDEFVRGQPAWGVCAGAILLAREVRSPAQASLAAIEISVERNAYGRQLQSFVGKLETTGNWADGAPVEGVFIRAPRIVSVGGAARVLLRHAGEPVMVEQGKTLASTFHPELTGSTKVHEYFVRKCGDARNG
jgi:5'-phosphate synthase pdxT subunit